jgi:hypothetical protein
MCCKVCQRLQTKKRKDSTSISLMKLLLPSKLLFLSFGYAFLLPVMDLMPSDRRKKKKEM